MSPTAKPQATGLFGRLLQWSPKQREAGGFYVAALAIAAIAATSLTYLILAGSAPFAKDPSTLTFFSIALVAVVLGLIALIAWRLFKWLMARRAGFAGVKLHTRLVTLFSAIAAVPAVIVAVFSYMFLFVGMESWFSERQRAVVDHAETVAEAFLKEHQDVLRTDVVAAARDIDRDAVTNGISDPSWLNPVLFMQANLRALNGAYIIDRSSYVVARAEPTIVQYLAPTNADFDEATLGRPRSYIDYQSNQTFCLVKLDAFPNYFLYSIRPIDPNVIQHLKEANIARTEFETAKKNRGLLKFDFFLGYLAVALVILLAAISLGVWAANQIVHPVSRLIGAADRISSGDLAVKVDVGQSDDEIGRLARAFNRMTTQLETQRAELIEANRQVDRRRRFTEAVLSGVSAGVMSLDPQGLIALANRSAVSLLCGSREDLINKPLEIAAPEFAQLAASTLTSAEGTSTGQIELVRAGRTKTLLVRVAREMSVDQNRNLVITFDDISALVAAQRTSAWADVARRIAHEIKNPLTPIQLSAERLRRKYRAAVSDPEIFDQCTATIIRQVTDIGRMVDEFSSFARMPAPQMADEDLNELVRQAAFLQRVAYPETTIAIDAASEPVREICDRRLVTQALTNILKNAGEAVAARRETAKGPFLGEIRIRVRRDESANLIEVIDNGCGLPKDNRNKLTEPYVTTRPKGTGLGLAIVKKIMEEHGGLLELEDSPLMGEDGSQAAGALVRLRFAANDVKDSYQLEPIAVKA